MNNLTAKQKKFIHEYLKSLNATQAYLAVYKCSYDSAKMGGYRLLQNDNIKSALKELAVNDIDKNILVLRMRQLLEFDITEVLDDTDQIDLNKIRDSGLGWVVTAIKPNGEVVIVDKNKVLDMLAKVYKLYDDQQLTVNLQNKLDVQQQLTHKLDALADMLNSD